MRVLITIGVASASPVTVTLPEPVEGVDIRIRNDGASAVVIQTEWIDISKAVHANASEEPAKELL